MIGIFIKYFIVSEISVTWGFSFKLLFFFFLFRGRMSTGGGDLNSLTLLPSKLKTEIALHVNLDTLKKVNIRLMITFVILFHEIFRQLRSRPLQSSCCCFHLNLALVINRCCSMRRS